MALGFMTFGYVSDEFEITEGRLGCYLPVEHIDNPKGYGEGQDPRQFYPGLRPPVDPRELQIDPQTGMKAYIAMEGHGWDTSKACIRRTIERCIHHGRLHRSTGRTEDEYEAYRLLGQAMHTLEDFPAHSNFCELALIKLGYTHVFPHVGQNARIKAPNGAMVPPLVTGTFGGSDFIHSLLGEAGDHLSEASISDLNKAVSRARSDPNNSDGGLVGLLRQIPGGDGEQASRDINEIRAAGGAGGDPNSMSPQQLHETLWKILVFRDKVMKGVETTIDRIPGLGALIEKITSSINVFIFSTIEPYLGPVLKQATGGLNNLSEEVINNPEQFAVFDNPNSDDPTHSFLSKDHFGLILNEPAGNLAKIIIRPAIKAVVEAWEDPTIDPRAVAERACEALFHPCFGTGRSQVQQEMLDYMHQWIESQGSHKQEVLNRLTAAKVRSNDNRRIGDTSSVAHSHDHHAGGVPSQGLQGVLATHNVHVPGAQYLNMGQDLLQGKMPGSVGFGSSQGQGRWRDMETSTAGGGGGSSGGGGYDSAPPPPAVQHAAAYGQPQHQHQPYQQQYQQPTSYGQPALQQQQHYQQHPQSSYGQPPPPPPSYGQQVRLLSASFVVRPSRPPLSLPPTLPERYQPERADCFVPRPPRAVFLCSPFFLSLSKTSPTPTRRLHLSRRTAAVRPVASAVVAAAAVVVVTRAKTTTEADTLISLSAAVTTLVGPGRARRRISGGTRSCRRRTRPVRVVTTGRSTAAAVATTEGEEATTAAAEEEEATEQPSNPPSHTPHGPSPLCLIGLRKTYRSMHPLP